MNPAIRHASPHPDAAQPMRMHAPTHRLAGERVGDHASDRAGNRAADRAADRAARWALVAMQAPAPAEADDAFGRCGWFDSSLDLAAGLQVIEHLDTLPEGLPLLQAA